MELKEVIESRINDLMEESLKNNYLVSTKFLSLSEQNFALSKINELKSLKNELDIFLYGGNIESDRKKIYFIPKFYSFNQEDIKKNSEISLLKITPKNLKFSESLTHRDVLGSLMSLNYSRNMFGDIIIKDNNYFVYLDSKITDEVSSSLDSIKHTSINITILNINDYNLTLNFKEIIINVASLRLDSIIKEVFKISRNDSQELIKNEFVFINGNLITSTSYEVKENDRISVKSKGKFIFLNMEGKSRKERLFLKIKLYS